jgi:hypothetical protein
VPREVIGAVEERYGRKADNFSKARLLLIFFTSKQKTWLIATNQALHCVVDRLSEPKPRARWRIEKNQILSSEGIILLIKTEPRSERTGVLIIDQKRPRLFSRSLFTDAPIERRIRSLILEAFDVAV